MSEVQFLFPPGNDEFLAHFLDGPAPQVVSLVGAGGKTSALFWLANALYQRGARVLVTTTTRMQFPDPRLGPRCIIEPEFETRLARLAREQQGAGVTAVFSAVDELLQKVAGCLPGEVDVLKESGAADVILVEADGARHLAIKAPGACEPCIPAASDAVIALTGAGALLQPANPALIHRWAEFAAVTGVREGELVDERVLDRLLSHPQGMFKSAPAGACRHWLVNTGSAAESAYSGMLESLAVTHSELAGVWVGNLRYSHPFTRAWVRTNRKQEDSR